MKRTRWGIWGIPLLVAACPGHGGVGVDSGADAGAAPDEAVVETAAPPDEAGLTDPGGADDAVGPDARDAVVPTDDSAPADPGAGDPADRAQEEPGTDDAETPAADLPPDGIGPLCFADKTKPGLKGPNYDQFHPVVASHCYGTNHQDIHDAALAGMKEWEKPEVLADIVIWILEQYMRIAVEHEADMIFLLEHFCGHGYVATGPKADPENRCYEGPDAPLYFDVTCVHPSAAGHSAIDRMFRAEVEE